MLREIDGVRINVLDEGHGQAIVFLHGLGGCWRDWAPQLDNLSDSYRCVVVEHRGHGRSQRVPGPYSTDLFAADVRAVCDHLGIEHAYVVGLSMGGMVAQKLALAAPDLVDALVLCDTFTHTASRRVAGLRAAADAVRAEGFGALRSLMAEGGSGWSAHTREHAAHVARDNLREAESNDPDCWAWAVEALVTHDMRAEIGRIAAPSLVVWGAEDQAVPVKLAQPLADALGGAPVVVLDDAGHVCNLEQPGAFDRAITAFFEAHPPRSARFAE
jgi:pimeloyl-ACP methyl ester carboxylesterase